MAHPGENNPSFLLDSSGFSADSPVPLAAPTTGVAALDSESGETVARPRSPTSDLARPEIDLSLNSARAVPFSGTHENAAVAIFHSAASLVAGTATAAPEPSTLLLLGCGLMSIGGIIRRKLWLGARLLRKRNRAQRASRESPLEERA
jgi:PEP-CTERM motif